jgi:GNAT superfamily N-acetyltransferase
MTFAIRPMKDDEAGILHELILGLADYERLKDQVTSTPEMLKRQIVEERRAHVLFATVDDKPVGFALYFYNFSTFVGKKGLYLEDLFILPEHRKQGYGKALFLELAAIAKREECGRMEWTVLDWNAPSIAFYQAMGAKPLEDWTIFRLDEKTLKSL